MQLLADTLIALQVVDSISDETVRETLKKRDQARQQVHWCFPTIGADFVWRMEDVLDLYAEPYDSTRPRVCLDEVPMQLVSETRRPQPVSPGQPVRGDYEYKREGTCNLFILAQSEVGVRHVTVTDRRTAQDFAHQLKALVDERYPEATVIRLVTDNLNIHSPASLSETFIPGEARRIAAKLEWHCTPKHTSWLNQVEIEIGVLSRQCLKRRIPTQAALAQEVAAWETVRNAAKATIDWRFTSDKARAKLSRLYPSVPE